MTELADVGPGRRVLEVGTGCGYQTAVLAALGAEVFSIEILQALSDEAAARLAALGASARLFVGDGHRGLPDYAPYDAILVTAAPEQVPHPLVAQLAPGGRLVVPVDRARRPGALGVRRTEQGERVDASPVRSPDDRGGAALSLPALVSPRPCSVETEEAESRLARASPRTLHLNEEKMSRASRRHVFAPP